MSISLFAPQSLDILLTIQIDLSRAWLRYSSWCCDKDGKNKGKPEERAKTLSGLVEHSSIHEGSSSPAFPIPNSLVLS